MKAFDFLKSCGCGLSVGPARRRTDRLESVSPALSVTLLAVLFVGLTPLAAFAEEDNEIRLLSCDGDLRFSQVVEAGEKADISIQLEKPLRDGESLTLTSGDGTVVKAGSADQTAVLVQGLSAGTWKVCGFPETALEVASIASRESGSTVAASTLGLGALAAGGIAVGIAEGTDSSSQSGRGGAGSPDAGIDRGPNDTGINTAKVTGLEDFDDDDFDFGAAGNPLSPFD